MNIFELTEKEFDEYIESKEGQEFLRLFKEQLDKDIEEDPYFFAKWCYNWQCPYNSGHSHNVEMGEMTRCEKFQKNEENDCKDIEEVWWW